MPARTSRTRLPYHTTELNWLYLLQVKINKKKVHSVVSNNNKNNDEHNAANLLCSRIQRICRTYSFMVFVRGAAHGTKRQKLRCTCYDIQGQELRLKSKTLVWPNRSNAVFFLVQTRKQSTYYPIRYCKMSMTVTYETLKFMAVRVRIRKHFTSLKACSL